MTVNDFIALDADAYAALWDYILKHDLVTQVRMDGVVGVDDPASDLLLEPRVLQRRTWDHIWMRVVDAGEALRQRPYAEAGSLAIAVEGDDMCPWNNRTYGLHASPAGGEIGPGWGRPDLTVSPNALASLIAGHRSATSLARAGLLDAARPESLAIADRIFRTAFAPHCPNHF
jgi:predicted acetyltransferase